MVGFSPKERELLEKLQNFSDFSKWYEKTFCSVNPKKHESRQSYYRNLKTSINRKVKKMKKDLELYRSVSHLFENFPPGL